MIEVAVTPSDGVPYILLIEDSAAQRSRYREELLGNDYPVVAVGSGADALVYLKNHDYPAVVISDWELPDITGLQLLVLIRAMHFRVRPYLIMLTQRSHITSVVTALDRGADDYIVKPGIGAELASRLRVALRSYQLQAELVERVAELEAALGRERIQTEFIAGPMSGHSERVLSESHDPALEATGSVFHKVGLDCRVLYSDLPPTGDLVAWAAVALPERERWVDLRLFATQEMLQAVARDMVGRRRSPAVSQSDLLAELVNLIRARYCVAIGGRQEPALTSLLPRCFRVDEQPDLTMSADVVHYEMRFGHGSMHLTVETSTVVPERYPPPALRPGLVLSSALTAPGSSQNVILKAGTILNGRLIRRLIELGQQQGATFSVAALQPSVYARTALQLVSLSSRGPVVG